MDCPYCQSQQVTKRGVDKLQDGSPIQRYRCKDCGKRFNERTGTPMARLRTCSTVVSYAVNARTEGMGVCAAGRTYGNRRVEWVKIEHPFTAISPEWEVHANHNEAQNAALRRRCSAYRRRQNLYAKKLSGLQRVLDIQRLIHNWVRPHWGLGKRTTPAMKMGFCSRPLSTLELLNCRGFKVMPC